MIEYLEKLITTSVDVLDGVEPLELLEKVKGVSKLVKFNTNIIRIDNEI